MENIPYIIIEDQMEPNSTFKWAKFSVGDSSIEIPAILDSEDDTLIDEDATQNKVNEWVEVNSHWNETV